MYADHFFMMKSKIKLCLTSYFIFFSPMIHTTVLSGLTPGMTYYYMPMDATKVGTSAGGCQTSYSFTMPAASGTSSMYPTKLALVADLGTTDVSAKSVSAIKAMNAVAIVFTGDLSYGKKNATTTVFVEPLFFFILYKSVLV